MIIFSRVSRPLCSLWFNNLSYTIYKPSTCIYLRTNALKLLEAHRQCWRKNPALLLGISFLLGASSYLYLHSFFYMTLLFIYLGLVGKASLFRGFSFALLGAGYAFFLYHQEPLLSEPIPIQGVFSIASIQPHQSPFQKGLIYKGTLHLPQAIPCQIHLPLGHHPKGDCDYWVDGTLLQRGPYQYAFKPKQWRPLEGTWSLAETRFVLKEKFRALLRRSISSPETAALLGSLVTADVEDRMLRYQFGRVGLQHLLAISGFHFAILIAFASFFLGLVLPERIKLWTLLAALSIYFLFVGSGPAVLRSFITALLYIIGRLIRRYPSALNLLGCAILFETIWDPLVGAQISFQLSFVSCAGLLFFLTRFEKCIYPLLPKRTATELSAMTLPSPYGYLLLSFLRKNIALSLAVNLPLLPLLLYHFHTFPLLGLFYNLFFPFLIGLCLFSLLTALIAYAIWTPLGLFFLKITEIATSHLLDLAAYPPSLLDHSLRYAALTCPLSLLYLATLFFIGISLLEMPSFSTRKSIY